MMTENVGKNVGIAKGNKGMKSVGTVLVVLKLKEIESTAVTRKLSGHKIKRREKQMVKKLGLEEKRFFLTVGNGEENCVVKRLQRWAKERNL